MDQRGEYRPGLSTPCPSHLEAFLSALGAGVHQRGRGRVVVLSSRRIRPECRDESCEPDPEEAASYGLFANPEEAEPFVSRDITVLQNAQFLEMARYESPFKKTFPGFGDRAAALPSAARTVLISASAVRCSGNLRRGIGQNELFRRASVFQRNMPPAAAVRCSLSDT